MSMEDISLRCAGEAVVGCAIFCEPRFVSNESATMPEIEFGCCNIANGPRTIFATNRRHQARQRYLRVHLTQQFLDHRLGVGVSAFTHVHVAKVAILVDEVLRRPCAISEELEQL